MDRLLRPSRLIRPVELAHCPPFRLGQAEVRPATRELVLPGGRRAALEPRVMQVLVALAEANGEILSRGDLNDLCWEGVAVSNHAMNRVISRLRAVARETGAFQIETINKVGYRLTPDGAIEPAAAPPPDAARVRVPARRAVIAGGGLTLAAALGAALWWASREARRAGQVDALVDHAWEAFRRQREDEFATAVSSLHLALEKDPDNARAWGVLALTYALMAGTGSQGPADAERARDAIARTLELDPGSEYALAANAWLAPVFGNWLEAEQICRAALAKHPRSVLLLDHLTELLLEVGRRRDALRISAGLQESDLFSPSCWQLRAVVLQDNGRIEEAAQTIRQGLRLYPRHPSVWFTNLNFLADTGRIRDAARFLADRESRPIGVGEDTWDVNASLLRALDSRTPHDIDETLAALHDMVPQRLFSAGRAVMFATTVGRIDDAYRMLDDYYFGSGAAGPRGAHVLFRRATAPLRADARFPALTARIGLDRYWRTTGMARPA